jgi:hypothetical protein
MQYGVMGQVLFNYYFCGIFAGQSDHLLPFVVIAFNATSF